MNSKYLGRSAALSFLALAMFIVAGCGEYNYTTPPKAKLYGIAVDATGNVYVTDTGYPNVTNVRPNVRPDGRIVKYDAVGTQIASWQVAGSPHGIAVNSVGEIYVANIYGSFIKYDPDGVEVTSWTNDSWPMNPTYPTMKGAPNGLALDSAGNVYATAGASDRIFKYDSTGTQLSSWTTPINPYGVALDSTGNVYTTITSMRLVNKYDPAGNQIASWTTTGRAYGIAVDSVSNVVYVADTDSALVRKYDSSGNQLALWSTTGAVYGIAVDASGNVYVADSSNAVVRKYDSTGTQIASWPVLLDGNL